jgi:hypothetical protein
MKRPAAYHNLIVDSIPRRNPAQAYSLMKCHLEDMLHEFRKEDLLAKGKHPNAVPCFEKARRLHFCKQFVAAERFIACIDRIGNRVKSSSLLGKQRYTRRK